VLSAVLRLQGRVAEARALAERTVQWLEQREALGLASVSAYLALAEACLAEGDRAAGQRALRKGMDLLNACANDLPDAALRARLVQVPPHARLIELAQQHLSQPGTAA